MDCLFYAVQERRMDFIGTLCMHSKMRTPDLIVLLSIHQVFYLVALFKDVVVPVFFYSG